MSKARARGTGLALGLALALGVAAPAAGCARPAAPAPGGTLGVSATRPAGLDPAALRQAIEIRPGDHAAGVIARVRLGKQAWRGQVADTVTGRAIAPDSHIRLGSITKAFEAVVALRLAARHVIDLDRPVQSYLPGLLPSRYQLVTTRRLLNMTSGLPQVDEGAAAQTADQVIAGRYARSTLGQIIEESLRPRGRPWPGPHFAPGTEQQYDSLNYRIVAYLIERRTGHSFAAEVRNVHFPAKELVLFEIMRGAHERALDCVKDPAIEAAGDAAERLAAIVSRYTAWHARHHVAARVCQYELAGLTPGHYDEIVQVRHQTNEVFRAAVERGAAEGTFVPGDVNRLVRGMLSLSIDLVRWYRLDGPDSPEQLGRFYAELALRMVMDKGS